MAYTTIDDPSAYFQTKIYTGNGSSNHAITFDGNSNMQPDWIWNKSRSIADSHAMFDSTRGINKILYPNVTLAEGTDTNGNIESFDSNGITVGGNQEYANKSGSSQVTWAWKANGGTTSSNTDGDITTTVQANTTAGFSIFTYTGTGTDGDTIGHGLGAVPNWIWIKARSIANDQTIYHSSNTSAPETEFLILQGTDATSDSNTRWSDTAPTSTLITLGNNAGVNGSTQTYVGYAFAEKQGYSKFGRYNGNGNTDGPFINTGFKPAWVMLKRSSGVADWNIFDNKRPNAFNEANGRLRANDNTVESTSDAGVDLLSNGFKCRLGSEFNANNTTNIYMAFAESPFVSSEGVPVTAR